MQYLGEGHWTVSFDVAQPGPPLEYRYAVLRCGVEVAREPVFRQVEVRGGSQAVLDQWLAPELPDAVFLRQAFAGIICPAEGQLHAEDAARILHYESKLSQVTDPLAGSYYIEAMTDKIEAEAWELIKKIDDMGGPVGAIERGFLQRSVAQSAYEYQRKLESKEEMLRCHVSQKHWLDVSQGQDSYLMTMRNICAEIAKRGAQLGYETAEVSWTLEDNTPINLTIRAMGCEKYKTYRIYEKPLAS
jgi:hypothetical protein